MLSRLKRSIQLIALGVLGWSVSGCQTAPPPTGFETEEQIRDHLEKTQLLHRRAKVELKGGGAIPFDSDMEPGPAFGIKASMEAYKNLFFGFEYGYSNHEVDETLEDFQRVFNVNPGLGEQLAADADPEQYFEEFDRHNFLLTFDYEIPLGDGWGLYTPIFRAGAGIGATIVIGDEVPDGTLADETDARIFGNFLFKPSVGIDFPIHENVRLFAEVNADVIPDGKLTIKTNLSQGGSQRRTRIDDSVNFSSVSFFGGVTITW